MLLLPRPPVGPGNINCSSSDHGSSRGSSRGNSSSNSIGSGILGDNGTLHLDAPPTAPAADTFAARQTINVLLGPTAMAMLASGGTHRISLLLSAVVAVMIGCFATTLLGSGVHVDVLSGLVPSIPDGASELALALIGTTAIPVNLLMGSSIARSSDQVTMRRGVGLASMLSGLISLLVLLVGSHVPTHPACAPFQLRDVAHVLEGVMGPAGELHLTRREPSMHAPASYPTENHLCMHLHLTQPRTIHACT